MVEFSLHFSDKHSKFSYFCQRGKKKKNMFLLLWRFKIKKFSKISWRQGGVLRNHSRVVLEAQERTNLVRIEVDRGRKKYCMITKCRQQRKSCYNKRSKNIFKMMKLWRLPKICTQNKIEHDSRMSKILWVQ